MRTTRCDICDKAQIPLNQTLKVNGKTYCENCLERDFPNERMLEHKEVQRDLDPTVCAFCNKDFGETELKKLSDYPVCDECEKNVQNKAFPGWVKAFCIGIGLIVIISFAWNWKFFNAYLNIREANDFFTKGDYANASLAMEAASEKVPKVEDLKTFSAYFKGIDFLSKDQSTEALHEFEKCKDKLSEDYAINNFIIQARMGSTFDHEDYPGFLQAAKDNLAIDTTLAVSYASVASAYACLYVDEGNEENKQNYQWYIHRAKEIDSTSQEILQYYDMLAYRVESKRIIQREQFIKEFPDGWNKN